MKVHPLKQVRERLRMAAGRLVQEPEDGERALLVFALARERRETHERESCRAVAGGDGVVLDVLWPRDELLVIDRGREESALRVRKALDHHVGERSRLAEPAHLEGRLVEIEQRLGEERM